MPILAICYGQQTMHQQLGGHVAGSDEREFGRAFIEVVGESALFDGLWKEGETHQVWMSHGDRVEQLAPGFSVVARSPGAPFAIATLIWINATGRQTFGERGSEGLGLHHDLLIVSTGIVTAGALLLFAAGAARLPLAARRWSIGSAKAAVLPVPVWAMPIRSRPAMTAGIACAWIGVGVECCSRTRAARIGWLRPKSEKEVKGKL